MLGLRFIDFFSGIGGFRLGMEMAGHECVGYVEWDKYARKSYEAMHNTKGEWSANDITEVTNEQWREFRGQVEVICGGFPCQAFSVAGNRDGFKDTRGTLFFEIARAAEQIKPRLLLLENVKGLLSHDKGRTFGTILNTLDELGYDAEWQVLNSKDFGVPQNRERIFIVGYLRGTSRPEVFPVRGISQEAPNKVIGSTVNDIAKGTNSGHWVHDTTGIVGALSATDYKQPKQIIQLNNPTHSNNRVYSEEGISPTLNCMQGGHRQPKIQVKVVLTPDRAEKRQNGRRMKEDGEPMFTLTSQDRHGVAILKPTRTEYGKEIRKQYELGEIQESRHNMTELEPRKDGISNTITTVQKDNLLKDGMRIRKLTPKECFRLQGFPDEYFERAAEVVSNSQLYKQAGNSVTVNVIYEIAKKIN